MSETEMLEFLIESYQEESENLNAFPKSKVAKKLIELNDFKLKVLQEKSERVKRPNGWVSVSERLPAIIDGSLDHSELYLVTVKNDKRTYTYLAYFGSHNGFSGLFGGDWNDYVIAWQPLPEPYKAVEE